MITKVLMIMPDYFLRKFINIQLVLCVHEVLSILCINYKEMEKTA